jgi:hypothetical protein
MSKLHGSPWDRWRCLSAPPLAAPAARVRHAANEATNVGVKAMFCRERQVLCCNWMVGC